MLDFSKPPFPENPACKNCMTRPCKRLFSGRVYPGKMIFVNRREFQSWPCHQPNFLKNQEDVKEEEVVLTDDIEVITEKLTVTNPRWEHMDEDTPADSDAVGDTIRLLADIKNYPDGAPVSFDIYDVTETTPLRIATARGSNRAGIASATWKVEDPQKRGEKLELRFEAIARSKASERKEIEVEAPKEYEFTLCIDPEDPESFDDKVILRGIDSEYEQIKTVADDKIPGDGMLTVGFTDCKKGDKYMLVHDDGNEQHTITEETVYGG